MSTVQNMHSETDGTYKKRSLILSREIREPFLKSLIRGQTIGIGGLIVMVAIGGIFERSLLSLLPLGGLAVIVGLAASWVLRRGHFIASGFLFFIGTSIAISINVYIRGYQDASTIYYLWPILGAVSTLEGRGGVVVLITSLLSYLTLAIGQKIGYLHPPIPFDPQGGAFLTIGSFSIMFSLLAYLAWLSSQNTNQALNQAQQSARKLQEVNETLENRVTERTHSLELAAEVGRSVSQVRALDVMLKDAAEIIRSRFDLYYTQVYLTNPAQNALLLQAGTGSVGAELVSRGHQLSINTASINGRAVVEKRSVVITDTTSSATFRPNPLLPNTRSEMAIPLMVGEEVVGVLDLQSQKIGTLNEESLPAFEALAGSLAIAIQNASLLSEAEQARADVEAQARRLVRANWEDYLDAIHKPEHTGFMFEQNQVIPLDAADESHTENALTAPIAITGEPIGSLVVELNADQKTAQNVELVNVVARQVAQQIENLRLLDSAERYRLEAEQAVHRVTREGWKTYMESASGKLGYMYNLNEVVPVEPDRKASENAITLPIKVRDDAVGKIALMDIDQNDGQAIELANAVAERLSAHIEGLRQFDQTQSALAQSEKLFEASRQLTQTTDLQGLVRATVESLNIPEIDRAVLGILHSDSGEEPDGMTITANWASNISLQATPIGTYYPKEALKTLSLFMGPEPLFFNDMLNDARIDEKMQDIPKRLNYRSVAALPLFSGSRHVAVLLLEGKKPHNFTQDEIRLFAALAPQIATVLENRRQYERAHKQAERESTLNVISQKIQNATTVEAVLQIAARELGHALGAPLTIAQLGIKDKK
jgi:GAF domain-containing protein